MDPRQPPRFISRWDLAALAGILALVVLYRQVLPLLPDPVPTHFDAMGRANGWTAKSHLHWVVFIAPLVLWGLLFLVGAAAASLPRRVRGASPVPIHPLRGLMGLGMCLLMGGCLLMPLHGQTALFSGLLAFFTCMALGIVFLVRDAWQSIASAPNPEHYRWGVFYVNPQDPRLWVEKRVGVGWTLNIAHPAAMWVTLVLALTLVALILVVTTVLRR